MVTFIIIFFSSNLTFLPSSFSTLKMIRKHNFCGKKVFSVKRRRGRKTCLMLFLWIYKVQINCLPCAVLGSKLLDLELKVLLDRVELAMDFLDSEIFLFLFSDPMCESGPTAPPEFVCWGLISLGGLKSANILLLTSLSLFSELLFWPSAIWVIISSHFPLPFRSFFELTGTFSAKISLSFEPTFVLGKIGFSANKSALLDAVPFSWDLVRAWNWKLNWFHL